MVSFWVYDVIFLILFSLAVGIFLYKNRKNLGRQGIMYLYRTKWGMKAIDEFAKKNSRFLKMLKAPIIFLGFVLMSIILYLIGRSFWTYVTVPQIVEVIKAPPLAPLIPYFPQLFGMQSFFPEFYFTYFLVALAIVAVCHEFSHGIFMSLFKTKIKSTGFAFLGPILAAFVEEDPKNLKEKKNSEQMTILGAGVFANVIFAFIFLGLMVLFFSFAFQPSGYVFNSYAVNQVEIRNLDFTNETIEREIILSNQMMKANLSKVIYEGREYFILEKLQEQIFKQNLTSSNSEVLILDNAPALKKELKGIIISVDGEEITTKEDFQESLENKNPGQKIEITTLFNEDEQVYSLNLSEHPEQEGKAYLGVGTMNIDDSGIFKKLSYWFFIKYKYPFEMSNTYYTPSFDGNFVIFIHNLLWWIAVINILVALFNMLPLGILDGGRFFYLGVLSVTKSEKVAKFAYRFAGLAILFMFVGMMFYWFIRII